MTRAVCAERASFDLRIEAFADQLADHFDEVRVRADRRGADHVEAKLGGELLRLRVEIVFHLHVIGDEADGRDDHVLDAPRSQLAQVIADVRFEPRLRGRA